MTNNTEKGRYARPEGSATLEYVATMSCSTLIFCIGCVFGWSAPSLPLLMGPDTTIAFTESDASILMATFGVGYTLAPALNTVMADKLGRRNSLLAISVPMIVHWGLISVARDRMVLFVARFLCGLTAGLGLCLIPMYMGEIASVKLRGTLGMIVTTVTNTGILAMFLGVPYVSINTSASICLGLAIVAMITIWFIPESPYFLAMVGRIEEAEDTLEKLRGKTDVSEELELVLKTTDQKARGEVASEGTKKKSSALKELIRVSGNRKALYINILFVFVLQFGGYVILVSVGHIIFEAMKTGVSSNLSATIIAILQLVFNILTTFVVDRIGRRPLICISGVVSGFCLTVITVYFFLLEYTTTDVTPYGLVPLLATFVNFSAVNIGLMPLQVVIRSETLAVEVKALVNGLIGIAGGVMAIISGSSYLVVASTWKLGHSVPFLGFTIVTWSCTAAILKLLPETKGRTFIEIQEDLNAS